MNLDATLSLEVVITILAIVGAAWRLEGRIVDSRRELGGEIRRLDEKIDETRKELRGDILRLETRIDDVHQRLETKIDDVQQRLETRIDRVDVKVDDGNQRLARLEGRFEGREERLATEGEADSPA
ncbi:MAG: hypothetical protein OXF44_07240 [Anaerolineaceae bacterium]|nr:hypothetical protein [Anaerolineaceae bacterium]